MRLNREGGIFLGIAQWKRPLFALRGESPDCFRVVAGALGLLSFYDGNFRDLLVWPQESPVSMRVARGPSIFLSSRFQVLGPHLELRP